MLFKLMYSVISFSTCFAFIFNIKQNGLGFLGMGVKGEYCGLGVESEGVDGGGGGGVGG
jgi:hypothetical protein